MNDPWSELNAKSLKKLDPADLDQHITEPPLHPVDIPHDDGGE